eukprot:1982708-Rhodomonas_salina.1
MTSGVLAWGAGLTWRGYAELTAELTCGGGCGGAVRRRVLDGQRVPRARRDRLHHRRHARGRRRGDHARDPPVSSACLGLFAWSRMPDSVPERVCVAAE